MTRETVRDARDVARDAARTDAGVSVNANTRADARADRDGAAVDAAITCTRVMGANGSLVDHALPRFLAVAQLLTMVDGASGVSTRHARGGKVMTSDWPWWCAATSSVLRAPELRLLPP